MKTLIAFLAALLALPITLAAQKEDNVWIYAGNRINFNTTPPTVTPVGINYRTEENITSVADRDGNLVYWLNGTSLYNSKDEVVFSLRTMGYAFYFYGLSIVPFPGRENVYIFVYPDVMLGAMVASVVDGSKDLLHPTITEAYAVFPYSSANWDGVPFFFQKYDSRDFWLLYSYGGRIKVYALTKDGFSYTGNEYVLPKYGGRYVDLDGCEMTPDRSKILATTMSMPISVFIDLDTKTGEINNINPINITSMEAFAFSSGNKYLYYTSNRKMYRIQVSCLAEISTNDEFLANSEFVGVIGCDTGDIKFLTSGGVYYMPIDGSDYLGMVKDCDTDHPSLVNHAVKMARSVSEHSTSSFLAFPKTYCYPYGFSAVAACGGEVQFVFNDENSNASFLWDFGDGNTSTEPAPHHYYQSNGKYTVSLTVNYHSEDNPDRTITEDVVVTNVMKKLVIVRE